MRACSTTRSAGTRGEPDLIVESPEITVKANTPDWWGEFPPTKVPITEDRYVKSVEIREVNNFSKDAAGRDTVGQRYVWHHLIWATAPVDEGGDALDASVTQDAVGWPVHEVGRNADVFDENAGRLLKAGSSIVYQSAHLHAGGLDVKSKLLFGFRFHPVGYKPARRTTLHNLANALDIDIKPNEANQQLHAYEVLQQPAKIVTFEPHLHAPGQRMCLEAIWGFNIQTLTCAATTTTGCGSTNTRTITRRFCRAARSSTSSATWTTRRTTRTSPIRATGRDQATARSRTCSSISGRSCR